MSVFDPTGNILVSTTLPAAFLEAAYRVQIAEEALTTNPNNVVITINDDAGTVTLAATIPVVNTLDSNGEVVIAADDYLETTHTAAGGGDAVSTTKPALLLELAQQVIDAEDAFATANPEFTALTTLVFDANAQTATIASTLPVTTTLVSGKATFTATDYLV